MRSVVNSMPCSTGVFSYKEKNKALATWGCGQERAWNARKVKSCETLNPATPDVDKLPAKLRARLKYLAGRQLGI